MGAYPVVQWKLISNKKKVVLELWMTCKKDNKSWFDMEMLYHFDKDGIMFYGYKKDVNSYYLENDTYYFVTVSGTVYIAPLKYKFKKDKIRGQTDAEIRSLLRKSYAKKLDVKPIIDKINTDGIPVNVLSGYT